MNTFKKNVCHTLWQHTWITRDQTRENERIFGDSSDIDGISNEEQKTLKRAHAHALNGQTIVVHSAECEYSMQWIVLSVAVLFSVSRSFIKILVGSSSLGFTEIANWLIL